MSVSIDLRSVIACLGVDTLTFTRTDPLTFTNGRADSPVTSTFDAQGSLQPTGRNLDTVPEAWRTSDLVDFWTETELRTGATGVNEPDTTVIDGRNYRVVTVDRWPNQGKYYMATMALYDPRA